MKISEPTTSHILLYPGLSQWKSTVYSLDYSSMVMPDLHIIDTLENLFHFFEKQSMIEWMNQVFLEWLTGC